MNLEREAVSHNENNTKNSGFLEQNQIDGFVDSGGMYIVCDGRNNAGYHHDKDADIK